MAAISLFWDTNMATVTSCAWLIVQVARNDVLFTFFSLLLSRTVRSTSCGPIQRSRSHFRGSCESLELVKEVIDGILS